MEAGWRLGGRKSTIHAEKTRPGDQRLMDFSISLAFEKLSEGHVMRRGLMREERLTELNDTPRKATSNGVL
jgi:hypothetical protein